MDSFARLISFKDAKTMTCHQLPMKVKNSKHHKKKKSPTSKAVGLKILSRER